MNSDERTPYETNPVESPADAICAFVEAFDVLQAILYETGEECDLHFADALRTATYRPVHTDGENRPAIGLYEIGVVYVTDGKYGINERKLSAALRKREDEIRALFVQEDGILPRLCEMLSNFLYPERDEIEDVFEESEPEPHPLHDFILRFLNECRRMIAMWE